MWFSALFIALAQLSESATCRAAYVLPRPSHARVCLGPVLWESWLHSSTPEALLKQVDPSALYGNWRVYSPLENAPRTELGFRKSTLSTLKLTALPAFHPSGAPVSAFFIHITAGWVQMLELKREALSQTIAPFDPLGVFRSILLSEKTSNDLGLVRTLGFVHLAVASGLHLYLLAQWTEWLLFFSMTNRRFSQTCAVGTVSYAWLIGGAHPAMLTPWLILTLRSAAKSLGLRWNKPLILAAVLGVSLIFSSFKSRMIYALALYGGGSSGVGIGAWSLLAFWQCMTHGTMSALTPVLSAILVPLFAGIVYPSLVALSLLPTQILSPAAHWLSPLLGGFYWVFSGLIQMDLRVASVWVITPHVLLLGAWLSLAFLPVKRSSSFIALLFLTAIILRLSSPLWQSPHTEIEQLDVGQGDAALITSGQRVGMIDTGAFDSLSSDEWITLFATRGLNHIDWIALTHLDLDHAGGARRLASTLPVTCIETSEEELASPRGQDLAQFMREKAVPVLPWGSGCVPFPTLAPPHGERGANAHMGSILIPLSAGAWYLSMGDAEGDSELALAKRAHAVSERLHWDGPLALKLSHHGSRTSSSLAVLKILHPEITIISDGIGNTYGHPSDEVLARVKSLGLPILRTDQLGSIDIGQALKEAAGRHPLQIHHP
jgi:competence protein ComEC